MMENVGEEQCWSTFFLHYIITTFQIESSAHQPVVDEVLRLYIYIYVCYTGKLSTCTFGILLISCT